MKSIAQLLIQNNIVQIDFQNPFTWSSGIKSPIYCDCRELISIPKARDTITKALLNLIKEENLQADTISGTATAGIPWASFVAQNLNLPMLYVRSKPKGHGMGEMVEGRGEKGASVLILEDAISTGGSAIESAKALRRELKAEVNNIVAIFSWSTPLSPKNAADHKLNIFTLTQFSEISEALLESGKITKTEQESLEKFHNDPIDWEASRG